MHQIAGARRDLDGLYFAPETGAGTGGGCGLKSLRQVQPDAIMRTAARFAADPRSDKVTVGIGVCGDELGNMDLPEFVREAIGQVTPALCAAPYLPGTGFQPFIDASQKLVFGPNAVPKRIASVQANGGTNALSLAAFLLKQGQFEGETPFADSTVYVSQPTWGNHPQIFKIAGHEVKTYPYLSADGNTVDFPALYSAVENAKSPAVIVLHASCHNPSGVDLSPSEWDQLLDLIAEKQKAGEVIMPIFDSAYQGFGGGLDEDVYAIRKAAELEMRFFVAESYSKKMALYRHRTGVLHFFSPDEDEVVAVRTNLASGVQRSINSNCSITGAAAAARILNSAEGVEEFRKFLETKRNQHAWARGELAEGLGISHLARSNGMFVLVPGIDEAAAERLWIESAIMAVYNPWIDASGETHHGLRVCVDAVNLSNSNQIIDGLRSVLVAHS